jgi:hypothetical protein
MPDVSIEQIWESRQTYFRLKGVGRLLDSGLIRIRRLDTNEMLGPEGWKKQVLSNIVSQTLDGDDLLLEISAKLINHIDTGRAIELQVDELRLTEEILPGELHPYPNSKAVQALPPVFKFQPPPRRGKDPAPPPLVSPAPEPPHEPSPGADVEGSSGSADDATQEIVTGDSPAHVAKEADGTVEIENTGPPDAQAGDGGGGTIEVPLTEPEKPAPDTSQKPAPKNGETDKKTEPVTPMGGGRKLMPIAAALLVGIVLGFFSKPIYDEYFPSLPVEGGITPAQIALLEATAFGPLSTSLREVADKSPAGVQPDRIAPRTAPDRARLYYAEGARKSQENNKTEAVYWYKQSLRTCEAEALAYLGDAFVFGQGNLSRDARTGFQLLRLAAALGSADAKQQLISLLQAQHIPGTRSSMAQNYR